MAISLFKLPTSYIAMDLETTGLDSSKDRIVEIAGVKVVDGEIDDTFQTYVYTDAKISAEASKVNGITKSMLKDAPKIEEALTLFLSFSDGLPMIGHNAKAFDKPFIERACAFCSGAVAPSEWYDTMEIARKILGHNMSLSKLCKKAGVTNEKAHSALPDSTAVHECYQWLRSELAMTTTDARDFPEPAPNGPLAGEVVCFTGDCPTMSRHDLMQLTSENGGTPSNGVTLKTTLLVSFAGLPTTKSKKAAEYAERTGVRTIEGSEFFGILGLPYNPEPIIKSDIAAAEIPEKPRRAAQPKSAVSRQQQAPTKEVVKSDTKFAIGGCLVVVALIVIALFVLRTCISGVLG